MKLKNIAVAAVLISAAITATKDASAQEIVRVDNQPAVSPSPPVANPATYVASNSFTAHWSSVTGTTGYRLDVSPNSSFNSYVGVYQNLNVGNVTSRNVTGLNASTTYYYRVRAYNGAGISSDSNVVNVTTLSATGPPVVITNPATLNRQLFRHAQWLSRSARTDHNCLFRVRHDDELRAHHRAPDQDRQHVSERGCQYHRLNAEHHVPFPDRGHEQRGDCSRWRPDSLPR